MFFIHLPGEDFKGQSSGFQTSLLSYLDVHEKPFHRSAALRRAWIR
jgi:hypothetical protein